MGKNRGRGAGKRDDIRLPRQPVLFSDVAPKGTAAAARPAADELSFAQILKAVADGVSVVDEDYRLRFVNSVLIDDFGPYEGRTCHEYFLGRDSPCPTCSNAAIFAGGTTRYEWKSEKSGKTYELIGTLLRNPDGSRSKLEIHRDITERRALEQQLQQSQKMEAIGRLAGGVAHDFNNVLAVIQANAAFARETLASDHPIQRDLREILGATGRASSLVQQLLAFGRRQLRQPRVLDLNTIVAGMESMLCRLLGAAIVLETGLTEPLRPVEADPVQVQQVLLNLALNARDAMPQGGQLRIETANVDFDDVPVAVTREGLVGPGVSLVVADDGAGMDEDTRRRIFEPFFTTKETGKGTGLGLATVHGIVKQSGGEVQVESAPGRGARFTVYLPAHPGRPACEEGPDSPRLASQRGAAGLCVLLLEDDAAVRRATRRMLVSAGYEVIEAGTPAAALAMARDPDLVIDGLVTDVELPHQSGFEVADQLLAQRPHLAVVYVSGHSREAIANREAPGPRRHVLQKPFKGSELIRRLAAALGPGSDEG